MDSTAIYVHVQWVSVELSVKPILINAHRILVLIREFVLTGSIVLPVHVHLDTAVHGVKQPLMYARHIRVYKEEHVPWPLIYTGIAHVPWDSAEIIVKTLDSSY